MMFLHILILIHVAVPCACYADKGTWFYAPISPYAKNIMHMEIQSLAEEKVI